MDKLKRVLLAYAILALIVTWVTGGWEWLAYIWYSITTDSIIGIVGRTIVAGLVIGTILGLIQK